MADTTETEQHTGVGVFLIPAAADPITAASSEPAHCTTIWMGDMNDVAPEDLEQLQAEVSAYVGQLDGPVVVPTAGRGVLGADEADVTFLERTDALLALRDGLLQASPTAEKLMNAVEQYPEWTPHVTMGYPETPALAEYDGDAVTFDRVGVWIGPDQHEYPMGGAMSDIDQLRDRAAALVAAATAEIPEATTTRSGPDLGQGPSPEELASTDEEMPLDEPEDGEELITEIPVHGVATLEGKPTGDGRGFRPGALSFGRLPAPLGYEFESSHGGSNSRVAVVGRIDEFWTVPSPTEGDGVFEVRWRGVIMPGKPYGALAIESIVDGSYDGVSIVIDDVTRDVTEERAFLRDKIERDQAAGDGMQEPKDLSVDEIIDEIVGDGTLDVNWFSAARIRRFDMVPTGAFQEGYTALGSEFADELTDEQLAIAASALEDCGCTDVEAPTGSFIVSFDSRSDDGPVEVGPFDSAEEAEAYLDTLRGPGFSAEYEVRQLSAPTIVAAAFAPGTKDGPGWITHPTATARIRRYWVRGAGAAKIGWGTPGDFDRCRTQLAKYVQNPEWLAGLCSNMHKEALGVWPGQEGGGRRGHGLAASAAPLFTLVAAVEPVDGAYFRRRELPNPRVGLVLDGDAVYGYIAQWNVCHIGNPQGPNVCTLAPHSKSNYAMFRTGTVMTTDGPVSVGQITMGIGHADVRDSMQVAASHYDNTNAAVADITCGEDNFGIWFAGVVRRTITDDQRYALGASGRLSGDWRPSGSQYELIAALAVNVPGYPIPEAQVLDAIAASAEPVAIIAAGIIRPEEINEPYTPVEEGTAALSTTDIAGIAIAAAETVLSKFSAGKVVLEPGAIVIDNGGVAPELTAARIAFNTRLLVDARSAAKSKGI